MRFRCAVSLMLILVIGVLLLLLSGGGRANPISIDKVNNCGPLSYDNSSVYLKAERIEVMFSEVANVTASYTFFNDNSESTSIDILLPFLSTPWNVSLLMDQTDMDFEWITWPDYLEETLENVTWRHGHGSDAILFSLNFSASEEKTVVASYTRYYVRAYGGKYGNDFYCHFRYLVGSACFWNHSIDSAVFIFHIPRDELGKCYGDYTIEKNATHVTARGEFHNWTPSDMDEYIDISWKKEGHHPELSIAIPPYICLLMILGCIMVVAYPLNRRRRRRSQEI